MNGLRGVILGKNPPKGEKFHSLLAASELTIAKLLLHEPKVIPELVCEV